MTILGRLSPDDDGLSDIPELTIAAVEAARWNPGVGCLIDRVYPGLPLVLAFGYARYDALPHFDFFKPMKKLEDRLCCRFNKILVRDVLNMWYHRGVPGLGADLDEVAGGLRALIEAIRPSRIVSIGQSMGGYAAILFGMMLGVDRIVAFGPLSHLDPGEAVRYCDRSFLPAMQALRADPPSPYYTDLVQLGRALDFRGELHVIFGTHPRDDDGVSSNFDAVHALRLARLPRVYLRPYPESAHAIVDWLIKHEKAEDLLSGLLGGGRAPAEATPVPIGAGPVGVADRGRPSPFR
jgi:hypothetical protein